MCLGVLQLFIEVFVEVLVEVLEVVVEMLVQVGMMHIGGDRGLATDINMSSGRGSRRITCSPGWAEPVDCSSIRLAMKV